MVRDALGAMWRGEAEVDSLNRLVIVGGLTWTRSTSSARTAPTGCGSPRGSRTSTATIRWRRTRTSPPGSWTCSSRSSTRFASLPEEASAIRDEVLDRPAIGRVARPGPDPALAPRHDPRHGAHERLPAGPAALVVQTRSAEVPEMPKPFPLFEVFVYSPNMEAIHLRGGMVARGGIRWSDRKEDYRTEVLGLMKAQKVKNADHRARRIQGRVHPETPAGDAGRAEAGGARQYVTFMHGLLDITDNTWRARSCIPRASARSTATTLPRGRGGQGHGRLLRHGERGERALRVLAGRRVRQRRDAGFDHKALGITARGAWES